MPTPVALAPFPPQWCKLTHWERGAQGEACGSPSIMFTGLETRALLFKGCLSVWEIFAGTGAPWGAGLVEAPC